MIQFYLFYVGFRRLCKNAFIKTIIKKYELNNHANFDLFNFSLILDFRKYFNLKY